MTSSNGTTGSPVILRGPGEVERIPAVMEEMGARRSLLVVGPGGGSLGEQVKGLLSGRSTGTFTDVTAHVPSWEANLAVASAQEVHADSIVSLGGGSTAGYAKIVALALRLPWLAVPTTLSGAEMTSRYFVTTEAGKESGRSARSAARAVVRDPDLFVGVPQRVLASSAMSAVAGCLEVIARGGPAVGTAREGMALLWDVLPRLLDGPDDPGAREIAVDGAGLAGEALEAGGPGPAQILAEDLGATHRVDHGALLACLLPSVAAGVDAVPVSAGGDAPRERFRAFARHLGLPTELRELCAVPDPDDVVARLAERADLAGLTDHQSLLAVLKEAA
jgi:alcohol dehydrogenase class IV